MRPFADRRAAGRVLAAAVAKRYAATPDLLVLGLPRGGVPVAFEVATALRAPLDVFVVRKLGVPGHEELAMGAIATGNVRVLNEDVVQGLDIPDAAIDAVAQQQLQELRRREELYRGHRPPPDLAGRTVILVDDGLATGSTMKAAVQAVRVSAASSAALARNVRAPHVVVAVPVGSAQACDDLSRLADDVICCHIPEPFHAVGLWYQDFAQTTDDEVRALLQEGDHP